MKIATILLTVLAATAAPASAKRKPHRMTFQFAATVAVDYWANRDVTIPCHPLENLLTEAEDAHVQASSSERVSMLTDLPQCTIDITLDAEWYRTQREYTWIYCSGIVHEVGHIAGLDHDYGGVMVHEQNIVPWGCDHPIRFRRHWDRLHTQGSQRDS